MTFLAAPRSGMAPPRSLSWLQSSWSNWSRMWRRVSTLRRSSELSELPPTLPSIRSRRSLFPWRRTTSSTCSFPRFPSFVLEAKIIYTRLKLSGLIFFFCPQRAEAAFGEMCCHSPELQANRRSEGLLLQDGCGCCDVSGWTDVPEDDWHQEGPGRSPWG